MQRRQSSRRGGHLSKPDLKYALGFEVLDEIDGFSKRHSVFEPYTVRFRARATPSRV
jgi:hypothetical protein